jgi:hypothetical protein
LDRKLVFPQLETVLHKKRLFFSWQYCYPVAVVLGIAAQQPGGSAMMIMHDAHPITSFSTEAPSCMMIILRLELRQYLARSGLLKLSWYYS